MVEITAWLSGITALANMVKAWMDTRKAGIELKQARQKVEQPKRRRKQARVVNKLVIDPIVFEALVGDINAAIQRFSSVFNNPLSTPAEVDREEEIGRG